MKFLWICVPLFLFASPFILDGKQKQADNKLEQEIGQMILVGFRGVELPAHHPIRKQIQQGQIGGVILYDWDHLTERSERNISSPEQLRALTDSLQQEAPEILFIAIDQEGGKVARLKPENGFPASFSADRLGKLNRLAITRGCAEVSAEVLNQVGINLNFAPVVDLDSPHNPIIGRKERSFSDDPQMVVRHAREVVLAHQRHGVLTTLKHFPGMGSALGDTHEGFVDVSHLWTEEELLPFSQLIEEGNADLIMVGHTWNERLDAHYPATLSHHVVQEILRQRLRYKGVIVTDDLQMKAISKQYDLRTAVLRAILAGNDLLLFSNQQEYDEEIAPKVISIVREFVEQGLIPRKMIHKSGERIQRLKKHLATVKGPAHAAAA